MFKVEAIGNLGADAEVRESNGSKFITFRIAHSDRWENQNGEKKERTQWIDVVMSNAESKILPYLKQGVKVFVRGHGSLRVYSSPKERMMLAGVQINAQEVELCGGSADDVPRELIDPETSQLFNVTKHYWCDADTKQLKKDESKLLIDKRGNEFLCNKNGFVVPNPVDQQTAES